MYRTLLSCSNSAKRMLKTYFRHFLKVMLNRTALAEAKNQLMKFSDPKVMKMTKLYSHTCLSVHLPQSAILTGYVNHNSMHIQLAIFKWTLCSVFRQSVSQNRKALIRRNISRLRKQKLTLVQIWLIGFILYVFFPVPDNCKTK